MKKFFTRHFRKQIQKSPHLLEKVGAVILAATTEVTRVAQLTEKNEIFKGWVTIEKGIWHDDPNGSLVVNGKIGFYTYESIVVDKRNLITNGGIDFLHLQGYTNTSAGTRGAGFVAVSENASGASATHTTVAGEITTGGLARADADTKAHTNGTNVSTIEHTYTASSAFTAVQLAGLLNAASVGTLVNENTFTSVALEINDTLKVTWTITMG